MLYIVVHTERIAFKFTFCCLNNHLVDCDSHNRNMKADIPYFIASLKRSRVFTMHAWHVKGMQQAI